MVQNYTDGQKEAVIITRIVVNVFSLCGSMFIVLMFALNKSLRNFAFYLIFNVALSDMMGSIAVLMLPDTRNINENTFRCQYQGFADHMFSLSSVIWTSMIAHTLYLTVVNNMQTVELEKKTVRFTIFSYGVPFIMALILLCTGIIGITDFTQCWVKGREKDVDGKGTHVNTKNILWGSLCFYIPLVSMLIFNILMLTIVIRRLGNIFSSMNNQVINRLKLYPIILVVCWSWGCIYRILLAAGVEDMFWLKIVHNLFSNLNGFFNFLAYGMQTQVQEIIKEYVKRCRRCCGLSDGSSQALIIRSNSTQQQDKSNNQTDFMGDQNQLELQEK